MRRKLKAKGGPWHGRVLWLPVPQTVEFSVSRYVDHYWRGLRIECYKETYVGFYRLVDEKGSPRDEAEWCQTSFASKRVALYPTVSPTEE